MLRALDKYLVCTTRVSAETRASDLNKIKGMRRGRPGRAAN